MSLKALERRIVECERCPRLRTHCMTVAREKRRQFQGEDYSGRPVPGFGDPLARLVVVGLAPAAHGANRTGRMFTGDQSGVWLYRALFRAGFANQAESTGRGDGLQLKDAYVTAVARCAPPQNRLTPGEIQECSVFLREEINALPRREVYLALGQVALRGLWRVLSDEVKPETRLPRFQHGAEISLLDGRRLICSYHPSQQNTFTGLLTEGMFDAIFSRVYSCFR